MVILQTSFIQSLLSTQNIFGIILELGIIYIAYQKWKVSVDKDMENINLEIKDMKIDIKDVQSLSNRISSLDTTSQLMRQDLDYIKRDYESQSKIVEKMKDDLHRITGSMLALEGYFKQIIEKEK